MTASLHLHSHFIAERVQLSSTRTGRDHEKIHDWRHGGQIEHHGIFTAIFFAQAGNMAGVFQTSLQTNTGSSGNGGRDSETPERSWRRTDREHSNGIKDAAKLYRDTRRLDYAHDTLSLYEVHRTRFKLGSGIVNVITGIV